MPYNDVATKAPQKGFWRKIVSLITNRTNNKQKQKAEQDPNCQCYDQMKRSPLSCGLVADFKPMIYKVIQDYEYKQLCCNANAKLKAGTLLIKVCRYYTPIVEHPCPDTFFQELIENFASHFQKVQDGISIQSDSLLMPEYSKTSYSEYPLSRSETADTPSSRESNDFSNRLSSSNR